MESHSHVETGWNRRGRKNLSPAQTITVRLDDWEGVFAELWLGLQWGFHDKPYFLVEFLKFSTR